VALGCGCDLQSKDLACAINISYRPLGPESHKTGDIERASIDAAMTYPTAPVPNVISNVLISGFDLKLESTLRLSGKESEPSTVANGIAFAESKQAIKSKLFFQAEKTMLHKI
jgi:hypothetical protein